MFGWSGEKVVVLVIGGGGREAAICRDLKTMPWTQAILCAPGSDHISKCGTATCVSDLDITDSSAVCSFCANSNVGLVVLGRGSEHLLHHLTHAGILATSV